MDTDRIEKKILLKAPRPRVWKALTDSQAFGQWFGVKFSDQFAPGASITGRLTVKGYEHLPFEITIEKMVPESLFSWRWHPYAIDPKVDYSGEPTTLVVFELEETAGGTLLTVVESGFDGIPPWRQKEAHRANENGWAIQMTQIERYVQPEA